MRLSVDRQSIANRRAKEWLRDVLNEDVTEEEEV